MGEFLNKLLKVNAQVILINLFFILFFWLIQSHDLLSVFKNDLPFIFLIESAFFFLFGGLSSFSDSIFVNKIRKYIYKSKKTWSGTRSVENMKKNDVYIIEGFMLLVLSILLSL